LIGGSYRVLLGYRDGRQLLALIGGCTHSDWQLCVSWQLLDDEAAARLLTLAIGLATHVNWRRCSMIGAARID
jgi:hypothetical protein